MSQALSRDLRCFFCLVLFGRPIPSLPPNSIESNLIQDDADDCPTEAGLSLCFEIWAEDVG